MASKGKRGRKLDAASWLHPGLIPSLLNLLDRATTGTACRTLLDSNREGLKSELADLNRVIKNRQTFMEHRLARVDQWPHVDLKSLPFSTTADPADGTGGGLAEDTFQGFFDHRDQQVGSSRSSTVATASSSGRLDIKTPGLEEEDEDGLDPNNKAPSPTEEEEAASSSSFGLAHPPPPPPRVKYNKACFFSYAVRIISSVRGGAMLVRDHVDCDGDGNGRPRPLPLATGHGLPFAFEKRAKRRQQDALRRQLQKQQKGGKGERSGGGGGGSGGGGCSRSNAERIITGAAPSACGGGSFSSSSCGSNGVGGGEASVFCQAPAPFCEKAVVTAVVGLGGKKHARVATTTTTTSTENGRDRGRRAGGGGSKGGFQDPNRSFDDDDDDEEEEGREGEKSAAEAAEPVAGVKEGASTAATIVVVVDPADAALQELMISSDAASKRDAAFDERSGGGDEVRMEAVGLWKWLRARGDLEPLHKILNMHFFREHLVKRRLSDEDEGEEDESPSSSSSAASPSSPLSSLVPTAAAAMHGEVVDNTDSVAAVAARTREEVLAASHTLDSLLLWCEARRADDPPWPTDPDCPPYITNLPTFADFPPPPPLSSSPSSFFSSSTPTPAPLSSLTPHVHSTMPHPPTAAAVAPSPPSTSTPSMNVVVVSDAQGTSNLSPSLLAGVSAGLLQQRGDDDDDDETTTTSRSALSELSARLLSALVVVPTRKDDGSSKSSSSSSNGDGDGDGGESEDESENDDDSDDSDDDEEESEDGDSEDDGVNMHDDDAAVLWQACADFETAVLNSVRASKVENGNGAVTSRRRRLLHPQQNSDSQHTEEKEDEEEEEEEEEEEKEKEIAGNLVSGVTLKQRRDVRDLRVACELHLAGLLDTATTAGPSTSTSSFASSSSSSSSTTEPQPLLLAHQLQALTNRIVSESDDGDCDGGHIGGGADLTSLFDFGGLNMLPLQSHHRQQQFRPLSPLIPASPHWTPQQRQQHQHFQMQRQEQQLQESHDRFEAERQQLLLLQRPAPSSSSSLQPEVVATKLGADAQELATRLKVPLVRTANMTSSTSTSSSSPSSCSGGDWGSVGTAPRLFKETYQPHSSPSLVNDDSLGVAAAAQPPLPPAPIESLPPPSSSSSSVSLLPASSLPSSSLIETIPVVNDTSLGTGAATAPTTALLNSNGPSSSSSSSGHLEPVLSSPMLLPLSMNYATHPTSLSAHEPPPPLPPALTVVTSGGRGFGGGGGEVRATRRTAAAAMAEVTKAKEEEEEKKKVEEEAKAAASNSAQRHCFGGSFGGGSSGEEDPETLLFLAGAEVRRLEAQLAQLVHRNNVALRSLRDKVVVPSSPSSSSSLVDSGVVPYPRHYHPSSSFASSWSHHTSTGSVSSGATAQQGWVNAALHFSSSNAGGGGGGSSGGYGVFDGAASEGGARSCPSDSTARSFSTTASLLDTATVLGGLASGSINGTVVEEAVEVGVEEKKHMPPSQHSLLLGWSEERAVSEAVQLKRDAEVLEAYDKVAKKQRALRKKEEAQAKSTWPPPVNLIPPSRPPSNKGTAKARSF